MVRAKGAAMRRKDQARYEALAKWLKAERDSLNWSTHFLAKRAKVPQSFISEVETGRRIPGVFDLMRLTSAMNVKWSTVAGQLDDLLANPKLRGAKLSVPRRWPPKAVPQDPAA